jgi:DNA-binding response OmpR family regulator
MDELNGNEAGKVNKRILIIDDEGNIRQMCRLALETAGYEVGEAEDGIEAFAILGGDPAWDVILLDQRLPMMEGTEVLRRISVLAPSARVVMMTAFASVELAVEAMKLGATDFLRKPMTPEIVRNSVVAALKKAAKLHAEAETSASHHEKTHTRTVTMNGFTILHETDLPGASQQQPNQRRFLVREPNGHEQEVVVEISNEALKEAEQVAKGTAIESEFWTSQAETFLSAFIWNDGNVPVAGKLVLKGVARDDLVMLAKQKGRDE